MRRRRMKKNAAELIERVRQIALALDDTTEKISHGEPALFVTGRMFATFDNDHHGSGRIAVVCNAPPGAQEALIEGDPKHFYRPPYLGAGGWIGVNLDTGLPWPVIADLVRQAHATSVRPRRTTAAPAPPRPRRRR